MVFVEGWDKILLDEINSYENPNRKCWVEVISRLITLGKYYQIWNQIQ